MSTGTGAGARAFRGANEPELVELMAGYLEAVARRPDILAVHDVADELMAIAPGDRVLDAGCGTGAATRRLAAAVAPGGEVVGLDTSPEFLALAERTADEATAVRWVQGDVTDLPFDDATFDVVRCERVLQHLGSPDLAVRDLVRVTRAGGRVCAIDTDWTSLAVDLGEEYEELADRVIGHFLTDGPGRTVAHTLRRRFLRAGLTDVRVRVLPMTFTSRTDAAVVIPQLHEGAPPDTGLVPLADLDAWDAATRAADAAGELWACVPIYVVCGTAAR